MTRTIIFAALLGTALLSANSALAASSKPLMLLVDDDFPDRDLPYCTDNPKPDDLCRPKSTAPVKEAWPFQWVTSYSGLFCRNYFSLKEAEAAVRTRDENWLRQTGCFQAGGKKVVLIEAPIGRGTNVWRGRFSGENYYFDEFAVENYARSGPYKDRAEAEKAF